jgi:hypothetical protein
VLTGEREAACQLAAMQDKGQPAWLVANDLGRALIPDDHRAAAATVPRVHALEVARRQGMVLDRHGQPARCRVERRPLGHGPRTQHVADPQALIGAIAPTARSAGAAGTVLFFPLMYFAGLWTPQMSATARHIGQFTPLGAAREALADSMAGTWPHPAALAVLALCTLVCAAAAARFFRWE